MGQTPSVPSRKQATKAQVKKSDDSDPESACPKCVEVVSLESTLPWGFQETFLKVDEEFLYELMSIYHLPIQELRNGKRMFERDVSLVEDHVNADVLQLQNYGKSAVYQWLVIAWMLNSSVLRQLRLSCIIQTFNDSGLTVVNVEPVLREHLYAGFCKTYEKMKQKQGGIRWEIAFHGTLRKNIGSIVREGFRLPNQSGYSRSHGTTWGKGIYCSPCPGHSAKYGDPWGKEISILLCAVLLGRKYQCSRGAVSGFAMSGIDSLIDPSGVVWVLFDQSQILPLCWFTVRGKTSSEVKLKVRPGDPRFYESVIKRQPGSGRVSCTLNI